MDWNNARDTGKKAGGVVLVVAVVGLGVRASLFSGKARTVSSNTSLTSSTDQNDNLQIWAEKIEITSARTVIHLASKGKDGREGQLLPLTSVKNFVWKETEYSYTPAGVSYLVDGSGRVYDVKDDSATYDWIYSATRGSWPSAVEDFWPAHRVPEGEIYRFTLTFPPLKQRDSKLKLHLSRFSPSLELDPALTKAKKTPAVRRAKKNN